MTGIFVFAVICVAAASVGFIRMMRFLKSDCARRGYILLPYDGTTGDLEKIVRSYYWEEAFESEKLGREILLVSLEPCENDRLAKRLEQEFSIVSVTDIAGLGGYLTAAETKMKCKE